MPGLSFLLKKKFHPARFDNQKRLFIAEQNQAQKNEREEQSAKEVLKEKEMLSYESMGAMEVRDPRSSSLKFMYAAPQSKDESEGKNVKVMASLQDYESKIDKSTGDDDMVRAFKAKIIQSKLNKLADLSSASTSDEYVAGPTFIDPPQDLGSHKTVKTNNQSQQSALEKEVGGRRTKEALTHNQLEERFAFLKNAPMEGGYAKGIAVKHQPFNEVVRNVQCARCGEWGHRSGDRECALKDYNPLDYARQQREDPMRHLEAPSDPRSSSASASRGTVSSSSDAMRRSTVFVDENGESDPEAEFLASLTRREKMLLLRKLQVIEDGGDPRSTGNNDSSSSSSSSDSSSSDSSSSDSESSESTAKKRKHKHKKSSSNSRDKKKSKSSSHKHRRHKKSRD